MKMARRSGDRSAARFKPIFLMSSQRDFLDAFAARGWEKQKIIMFVDEFSELYHTSHSVRNQCLRTFRAIRNSDGRYAIHSIVFCGTFSILRLSATETSIAPFNVAENVQSPYFTMQQTQQLFREFQQDKCITIDTTVVDDVWFKSNGCVFQFNQYWTLYSNNPDLSLWQPSWYGLPLWTCHLGQSPHHAQPRNEESFLQKLAGLFHHASVRQSPRVHNVSIHDHFTPDGGSHRCCQSPSFSLCWISRRGIHW